VWELDNSWMGAKAQVRVTVTASSLSSTTLFRFSYRARQKCAVLRHEWGAMTTEVKSMNMSGNGIAPEIADHPHVVM